MADMPENLDREESLKLQTRIKVHAKECYFNARRAILRLGDYETATYVEGFARTVLGMTFEHAWIVREGRIIDPTLPVGVEAYYPGILVHGREGLEAFFATHGRKYSRSALFHAFEWGGADHPDFHRARIQSERYFHDKNRQAHGDH